MKTKIKDSKTKEEQSVIYNGTVQFLTSFRLCEPKKVASYTKKLEQSALIVSEVNDKAITIKQGFCDARNESAKELARSMQSSAEEFLKESGLPYNTIKVSLETNPDTETYNPNKIYIQIPDKININDYLNLMIDDMNANLNSMPYKYLSRTDMLLQPISVSFDDIETNFIIMLSIFSNGLAILRMEYCIDNAPIKSLSEGKFSIFFDKCELPLCFSDMNYTQFGYYSQDYEGNEEDIRLKVISAVSGIIGKNIRVGADYKLLLMNDYSSKPDTIDNASHKYIKDIAYLVCSPVREYNEPSKKRMEDIVAKSHYEINKYSHVYVSTARKAIIAQVGDVESALFSEFGDELIEPQKKINRASFQGITPAVEVVLLKYFIKNEIADKCSEISHKNLKELLKIKKEVHDLVLFGIKSFRFKYDTMAKLTEFIDNMNTYMLSNAQIDEIISSFNDVVTTKESINSEKASALFSWLGIILTLIFSFTGVNEIIELINKNFCLFNPEDTGSLFSIAIRSWFILVSIVIVVYLFHRRNKK